MKLSIIIPIYNVENYIEKCLISCIKQDIPLNSYEIIVINDGSPDNSLAIAERFAASYSNIIIISQENQGLSGARNAGMEHAKGEYIWFVDSDDYIEENCLGRITTYLDDDLDVLQLQYRHVYENGAPPLDINFLNIEGIKNGLEVTELGGLPAPAQFSILRSQFLKDNKLTFVRGIYHEDSEFKPRVTYLAKKIASDNQISYNYLQRLSGSITSNFKFKNGTDILFVNNSLLDFMNSYNMPDRYRRYIYRKIGLNMNSLLYGLRQLKENDREDLICQLELNSTLFGCMIKSGIPKYQIEGLLFSINIKLGLFFHNLICQI